MKTTVMRRPVPIHAETFARAIIGKTTETVVEADWMIFPYVTPAHRPAVAECNARGIKTLGYWLGSDSWKALRDMSHQRVLPTYDMEMCVHDRIHKELSSWGRVSRIVPSCVRSVPPLSTPRPQYRLVGVYMPRRDGVYQFEQVCRIASRCEDTNFLFYGADVLPPIPGNCKNAGRLLPYEASELLKAISCLLRMCDHDGLAQNLIETKMLGKHVITNYPYEGCLYAPDEDSAVDFINQKQTHLRDMGKAPDLYREMCSPDAFRKKVTSYMEAYDAMQRKRKTGS